MGSSLSMTDFQLRPFRNGDEVQVVQLFKDVFHQERTVHQWKWKYEGQGLLNNKSVVASDERGRVVGHFGGVPLQMWLKDKVSICYQGADVMVHEKYRGALNRKGLYFNLCRVFYENLPSFVYGFSNLDHLRLGTILGFFEKAVAVNDSLLPPAKHTLPFYALERMDWDEEGIDALWNQVYKGLGWSIVRDRAFLQWRYAGNPFHSYRLYGLKKRFLKGILGWVVAREGNGNALFLTDMLFKDEHLECLLKTTASAAYREGKEKVVFWLKSGYNERLRSMGCASQERGTYITNCIRVKWCESSEMREQFYYTMGDTDFL